MRGVRLHVDVDIGRGPHDVVHVQWRDDSIVGQVAGGVRGLVPAEGSDSRVCAPNCDSWLP